MRTIRSLYMEDVTAAADLHAKAFPDDPWSQDAFASLLQSPGVGGWILFFGADEEPTGLLLARHVAEEAEILTLCSHPSRQRQGIASALLGKAITSLAALGAQRLFLEVAEDNQAARLLYQRFGLQEIARRPGYYRRGEGAPATALLLVRNLP